MLGGASSDARDHAMRPIDRRRVLKLAGGSAAVVTAAGLYGRYALIPPGPSASLDSARNLAVKLYESLDAEARSRACVEYEHPLRQYHNRGVRGGGLPIWGEGLTRAQRGLLTDLLHAGLSRTGRERIPEQFFIRWPGVHLMSFVFCGDPRTPEWQLILSGPHLNLRLGGRNREGVAFGGPLVYGDQRGNERQGLPGNLYAYQFRRAQRLFASLTRDEQRRAVLASTPIQTRIEVQGTQGSFPGVKLGALSEPSRRIARDLLDDALENFPATDVEYARLCLAENGGVDALSISYYEEGDVDGSGEYQIFRLEGPAAVLHFRGYPHVHAFINIAMDGERPLSVGEELGDNPVVREGDAVKALFERALRERFGTDLAYYDPDSVAGHLRAGPIRTGDIYTLESWQDRVAVVEVKGGDLSSVLVHQLRSRGGEPSAERVYSVATSGYVADELGERIGPVLSSRSEGLLRDAAIAHLREHGFSWSG